VEQHGDVVDRPGIGIDPPQPLEVPKGLGIVAGGLMDLSQQFHGADVSGIEDQSLFQEAVRGGDITGAVRANGVIEKIACVSAVVFALFVGPALAEGLFAAFLAGGFRHAGLESR
jgi:hypothetical protein